MSNRWNQTRNVNRRPKVCLSKHPIPAGGGPQGPCWIDPPFIRRSIRIGTQSPTTYFLGSLLDVPGTVVPLIQDIVVLAPHLLTATVDAQFVSSLRPAAAPGRYRVTLTAILPSGCNPTTVIDLTILP